jgi:peroxiredoxin
VELDALQRQLEDIRGLGATLIAISPQSAEKSAEVREQNGLDFQVLSDTASAYARQLSLTHVFPDDLREVYRAFDIDLPQFNGDESWELPLATRMVVDTTGTIRSLEADADYTLRPEVESTLEVLRSLA